MISSAYNYVNLPRRALGLDEADPCPLADRCLLTAIEHDLEVLASPAAGEADKLAALKFLGHWVGDVHQPMHVGFADDRGGGRVQTEGSCAGGLHEAWDGCLLVRTLGRDVSAIVARLQKEITPAERAAWVASRPVDWANESFAIATDPLTGYCVVEAGACRYAAGNETYEPGEAVRAVAVDDAYVRATGPVIRDQLKRAGVRLAHLLDRALGN